MYCLCVLLTYFGMDLKRNRSKLLAFCIWVDLSLELSGYFIKVISEEEKIGEEM